MGKNISTTVIIYLLLAILFLILISYPTSKSHSSSHSHRRLKLRSTFSFDNRHPTPFDPVVADIQRRRDDKEWEKHYFADHQFPDAAPAAEGQPEWEDFVDAEDYLNDPLRFNVTHRLLLLFPKIDVDADGFVTAGELTEWNFKSAQKDVMHRTERDMEVHDKNRDMLVSFQEYEPPNWARQVHNSSDSVGWWKEDHFNASDVDEDGFLNKTEFNDFLHPADSQNPKLLMWLCKEEIRQRDSDKDGRLSFKEYFRGIFDSIRNYDEESDNSSDQSTETPAKKLFAELDHDNDGYLSAEELLHVIDRVHPSERYYAKQQADYVISQADSDKDGRLSLTEMIDNPYVFYSAIFNDEDDYYHHDEFR